MAEIFSNFVSTLPGSVAQGLIWGIMAIGVYITFRILDVADLTVDGTLSTGAGVMVFAMMFGCNVWVAMILAFVSGCIAGAVTGFLHTRFHIPAILAGILTQIALYSVNLRIIGISKAMQMPEMLREVGPGSPLKDFLAVSGSPNAALNRYNYHLLFLQDPKLIPNTIVYTALFIIAIVAILYWFFGTELGHGLRATGSNEAMARANGINTDRNKVIGLVISNGFVALSGAMLAQYQGSADVTTGKGAIVTGLAAVIIGEVLLGKIFKNFALKLVAVAIGSVVYFVVVSFVLCLPFVSTDDLKLFTAIIVALFLGVPYWKNQIAAKSVKNKKQNKEVEA